VSNLGETLVGRTGELSALDLALDELERSSSSALALVGEPGMGKTRLLAELSARGEQRGHLVLSGSASELERELPFWVFVDALDEYLQGLEPRRLSALDDADRAQLGHVFPSLDADAAAPELGLQAGGAALGIAGYASLALAHDTAAALAIGSAAVGLAWGFILTGIASVVIRSVGLGDARRGRGRPAGHVGPDAGA
jgi:hypothetical protein